MLNMESDRTHEPVPVYEILMVILLTAGIFMMLVPGFSFILGLAFTVIGGVVVFVYRKRLRAVWLS